MTEFGMVTLMREKHISRTAASTSKGAQRHKTLGPLPTPIRLNLQRRNLVW